MDELNEKIEMVGKEIEGQLAYMDKIIMGSEGQDTATKSLERTVNAYSQLIKAKEDLEKVKADIELQKEKSEREQKESETRKVQEWTRIVLDIIKAVLAVSLFWLFGVKESIDEANGDIPSRSMVSFLKNCYDGVKRWFL
jgi:molecular chaperone GrpE (heat shock protein)